MKKIAATTFLLLVPFAAQAYAAEPAQHGSEKTIPGAKALFGEVQQAIADKYVDVPPNEDEIWSSAIRGVLDRLIQTKGIKANTVLDPDQLKELEGGLSGNLVGVGVAIRKFEGVLFVRGVIKNSSSEAAGLKPGDRILAIDGKPVKDIDVMQIVGLIRGQEGTTVDLTVQRDQRDWVQPLTRHMLKVDSVVGKMLSDKIGYVKIQAFNNNTADQLEHVLAESVKGAEGIVLDLRECPGGLFDQSLLVADKFLAPGATIVKLNSRTEKEDVKKASKKDPMDRVPLVVLVDRDTASSAEILAAALQDNDRAKLVGETTLGKGTVESVLKLSNGWGLKLSIARFASPKGHVWLGKGLEPDVPIAKRTLTSAEELDAKEPALDTDPQVRTALTILALRKR
jgi:carboxyl-terminal processing protease